MSLYKYEYWFKRRRPNSYKPVILITGCSSGIGFELAKLFSKISNYRTGVTARSSSILRLREQFPESDTVRIVELDITKEESRISVVDQIRRDWGVVDILINNAGISYRSVIEHMTDEDELLQMATNYLGPMALIRAVLPQMRPFGIDVSLIQPGFIHSESFKNVRYTERGLSSEEGHDDYSEFYRNMKPFVSRLMGISRTPAEKVAELILLVVQTERPPLWVPAGLGAEFFYYLRRLMPRSLLHAFHFRCLSGIKHWGEGFSRKRKSKLFG